MQVHVFDKNEVRTMVVDDKELFRANDVAAALGYKDPKQAVRKNVDPDYIRGVSTRHPPGEGGGTQDARYLTEPGLWQLVVKSRKPSAKRFQKWLFEEVIPSIRKHGGYHVNPALQQQIEQLTIQNGKLSTRLISMAGERLGQFMYAMGYETVSKAAWWSLGNYLAQAGHVRKKRMPHPKADQFVVLNRERCAEIIARSPWTRVKS